MVGIWQNLARILGVRDRHIPPATEDFWTYYQAMIATPLVDHPYVHRVLAAGCDTPAPPGLTGHCTRYGLVVGGLWMAGSGAVDGVVSE